MDISRWTREKSIIAPSVKKYRVYTPYRGAKKRNSTPDGKNSNFVTGARIAVLGTIIKITAILAPVTKVTFFQ